MKERIIVLDYSTANAWVYNAPRPNMQSEEIEEWLSEEMGFKIGNINWMSGNLTLNINGDTL